MACGKTTLGHALEKFENVCFIDLDEEIEKHTSMTIPQIFNNLGEEKFRSFEREILRRIVDEKSNFYSIIATGGGTPCNDDSMDFMLSHGTVVWLEASMERTIKRLMEAQNQRPLVANKTKEELENFVRSHFGRRKHFYQRAHHRFDSTYLDSSEEILETVGLFKEKFLN